MLRLLLDSGFAVEELIEVEVPEGSTTRYPWVPLDWARQWPCEEVWKARRVSSRVRRFRRLHAGTRSWWRSAGGPRSRQAFTLSSMRVMLAFSSSADEAL